MAETTELKKSDFYFDFTHDAHGHLSDNDFHLTGA